MRELITLHSGQAGVQVGHAVWELACLEHRLTKTGELMPSFEDDMSGEGIDSMFSECKGGNYSPRAILMDLEPSVIDEVRCGSYRQLWNPTNMISGKEDASSNYARAFYSQSRVHMSTISDRIRINVEQCDNLMCFKLIYSTNGGTGSGLTAAICDELTNSYGKKMKFATAIYPSPSYSEITVEPYNAILHTATTIDLCDCVVLADNQAIHRAITLNLNEETVGFTLLNRVVARVLNAQFLSHRYNFLGQQKMDVSELLINLVPYPRVHFPIMAYTPFVGRGVKHFENPTANQMLDQAYEENCQLASIGTADQPYISCAILFRGDIQPYQAVEAIKAAKLSAKARFVEWCPTGFKMGINFTPPVQIQDDCALSVGKSSLTMIAGNVGIRDSWYTTRRHFDLLYSKRAFIHWYVAEGMEEGEFLEAEDCVDNIIQDYEEIGKELDANLEPSENNAAVQRNAVLRRNNLAKTAILKEANSLQNHLKQTEPISSRSSSGVRLHNYSSRSNDLHGLVKGTTSTTIPLMSAKSSQLQLQSMLTSQPEAQSITKAPGDITIASRVSSESTKLPRLLNNSKQAEYNNENIDYVTAAHSEIDQCIELNRSNSLVTTRSIQPQKKKTKPNKSMRMHSKDKTEYGLSLSAHEMMTSRNQSNVIDTNWSAAARDCSEISLSESYAKVKLHSSFSQLDSHSEISHRPTPKPRRCFRADNSTSVNCSSSSSEVKQNYDDRKSCLSVLNLHDYNKMPLPSKRINTAAKTMQKTCKSRLNNLQATENNSSSNTNVSQIYNQYTKSISEYNGRVENQINTRYTSPVQVTTFFDDDDEIMNEYDTDSSCCSDVCVVLDDDEEVDLQELADLNRNNCNELDDQQQFFRPSTSSHQTQTPNTPTQFNTEAWIEDLYDLTSKKTPTQFPSRLFTDIDDG